MDAVEYTEMLKKILNKEAGHAVFEKMADGFKGQIPFLMGLQHAQEQGCEVNAGDLAEHMKISTARVATILNKLEAAGSVERVKSKKDGRITVVVLTEKGLKEVNDYREESLKFVNKLLEGIPDEEIMVFIRVLKQMTDNALKRCEGV